jgi:hypothetical protein
MRIREAGPLTLFKTALKILKPKYFLENHKSIERERRGMYLHGLASMLVVYHLGLE